MVLVDAGDGASADGVERKPLFRPPFSLFPFQSNFAAKCYFNSATILAADTGCIQGSAEVIVSRGGASKRMLLKDLVKKFNGGGQPRYRWDPSIPTMVQREVNGVLRLGRLRRAWNSGIKVTYTVTTETGRQVRATIDHPFLTDRGWVPLDQLVVGDAVHVRGSQALGRGSEPKLVYKQVAGLKYHPWATRRTVAHSPHRVAQHRLVAEADFNGLDYEEFVSRVRTGVVDDLKFLDPAVYAVHHKDHDHRNNSLANLEVSTHSDHHRHHAHEGKMNHVLYKTITETVVSVQPFGEEVVYDLEIEDDPHNFVANGFVVHNCGKSVISTATACLLAEDGQIDQVMIVAEKNKVWEWYDDIANYSELDRAIYAGTLKAREKIREALPTVLIGTYETFRNDLAKMVPTDRNKRGKTMVDGPLLTALEGKRVLIIWDEGPAKIGAQRKSQMYQAWKRLLTRLRQSGEVRIINCSATYVDRDPLGFFNVAHLMWPERVGTMEEFENDHVGSWDYFRNPVQFKNLHPDMCEPGKISLISKIGEGNILVKSKLDPDVVALFPKMQPDVTFVRLSPEERKFYRWMCSEYGNKDEDEKSAWMALRQFLAHPHSLFASSGEVAQDIVRRKGAELEAMTGTKLGDLIERLKLIIDGQGAQVVVFTWFGQSVLPLLQKAFEAQGWTVSPNHGQMSAEARAASQATWRAGDTQIFLSSDAGSRGINLPEGQYVEQYEAALKYSTYVQRVNRVSRINSTHATVVDHTWVVKDSVEEAILKLQGNRQEWSENLGTRNTLSAQAIRDMINDKRNFV
jgi:hypothetical protein